MLHTLKLSFVVSIIGIAGDYFHPTLFATGKLLRNEVPSSVYPKISPNDARTHIARANHLSREFFQILKKRFAADLKQPKKPTTPEEIARFVNPLIEFLGEFVVYYSDEILRVLSLTKRCQVTASEIYQETARLALGQIFPIASRLGCSDELVCRLDEDDGLLYDIIQAKLGAITYIPTIEKSENDETKEEFITKHTQIILPIIRSIARTSWNRSH
jgi:hypothetical protein